jgi:uncharacterized membrane protein
MMILNWKAQEEKNFAKIVASILSHNDISKNTLGKKNFWDSKTGALVSVICYYAAGAVTIFLFTDIPITNLSPCNFRKSGYPNVSECGMSISLISFTVPIVYFAQNYGSLGVFSFRLEAWMKNGNTAIGIAIAVVLYMTVGYHSDALLKEHIPLISFMVTITLNICTRCAVPALYYVFYYKQRSVVDEKIRKQFKVAENQPFSMRKLVDHAGTELETDSIVLYYAIKQIIQLRKSTKDTFRECEQLATLVFDNYVIGNRKTLDYYGLRDIVKNVKSPIELIEREVTVLVDLDYSIQEQIILPMFARMVRQNPEHRIDNM